MLEEVAAAFEQKWCSVVLDGVGEDGGREAMITQMTKTRSCDPPRHTPPHYGGV